MVVLAGDARVRGERWFVLRLPDRQAFERVARLFGDNAASGSNYAVIRVRNLSFDSFDVKGEGSR